MMNKRILFISLPNMGGCQRATINYAKVLSNAGYNCEFLVWADSDNIANRIDDFIPKSFPVKRIICSIKIAPFLFYKFIRRRGGYDCVFSSWNWLNLAICFTKLLPFCQIGKLVIRDDNMPSRHLKFEQILFRILRFVPDLYIAQTDEMQTEAAAVYKNVRRSIVIQNPLDKDTINAAISAPQSNTLTLEGCPKYIAVGRISPQKDYVTLINAFALVKKVYADAHLFIVGSEDLGSGYADMIKDTVTRYGLSNSVIFLGFQSNPYKYIDMSDVFVLSSVYEGLPNVMLEAIYLGKPVAVTTCIQYIDKVVQNGINGFKASVGDADSLAEAMIRAYNIHGLSKGVDVNNSDSLISTTFNKLLS